MESKIEQEDSYPPERRETQGNSHSDNRETSRSIGASANCRLHLCFDPTIEIELPDRETAQTILKLSKQLFGSFSY